MGHIFCEPLLGWSASDRFWGWGRQNPVGRRGAAPAQNLIQINVAPALKGFALIVTVLCETGPYLLQFSLDLRPLGWAAFFLLCQHGVDLLLGIGTHSYRRLAGAGLYRKRARNHFSETVQTAGMV
jgi:hypothetical protein